MRIEKLYTLIKKIIRYFYTIRLFHFFFTGGTGVILNLLITFLLTELVFGRENFFYAYLIGLLVNLIYNFTLHTILTFKTTKRHSLRLFFFAIYHISMSIFQAFLVRYLVDFFGVDFYLLIIATVIFVFSFVTFFIFKFFMFRNSKFL